MAGNSPSSSEIDQFTRLYNQGRLQQAIEVGGRLAAKYPEAASLDNMLGVVYARVGNLDAAQRHYREALRKRPGYAEANNNLGNLLARVGQKAEAVESFREALRIYPDYFVAHNNLGSALHDLGRYADAITSYDAAIRIKPDYAEAHNNRGNALLDLGKAEDALASFARALQHNPRLAQAHNNIGNCLRSLGRHDEAIRSFTTAIQVAPTYARAYQGLGNTLNDQGLHGKAVEAIRKSIELDPDSAAAHNDLGNALSDQGLHADAMASYEAALALQPEFAEVHSNLGNALCEFGDYEKAIASYGEALRLKPDLAEAYNNLSKIKTFADDDPLLPHMLEFAASPDISENSLMHLSFALGKVYDDLGDVDQAFEYLLQANTLRKKELGYDIQHDRDQFELIKSLFSGAVTQDLDVTGSEKTGARKPIFIVGMPRSGTTLTEQILASHSLVFGAGELQAAGRILAPFLRTVAAAGSGKVDAEVLAGLRDTYLEELEGYGDGEVYITDKMPANFRWIGFLLMAMPEARIINLNRDPAASCWSMYKLLFSGNGYTNDLADLADYYHLYQDLMEFWRQEFPNKIYDLDYKALTENQEAETRRLLEYCGLPWEDQCLDFHKTRRAVRTPSSKQVRKKMYTGSSDVWRKYEKHLAPLLEGLNARD